MPTNISFLQKLANHQSFANGLVETHFIERFKSDLFIDSGSKISDETYNAVKLDAALAVACICRHEQEKLKDIFSGDYSL